MWKINSLYLYKYKIHGIMYLLHAEAISGNDWDVIILFYTIFLEFWSKNTSRGLSNEIYLYLNRVIGTSSIY